MPSFKEIGPLVPEEKIFKGFYHIWAWRPSWSCDLDHLYKLWSPPIPRRLHIKFGFDWQSSFRGEEHGYTISTPKNDYHISRKYKRIFRVPEQPFTNKRNPLLTCVLQYTFCLTQSIFPAELGNCHTLICFS